MHTGAKFSAADQAQYAQITEKLAELCTVFTQVMIYVTCCRSTVQSVAAKLFVTKRCVHKPPFLPLVPSFGRSLEYVLSLYLRNIW
jgi:hypothetical protein